MLYRFWIILLFPLICFATPEVWKGESEEEALFLRRIADFWEEGEYSIAKNQIEEFLGAFPESSFADPLFAVLGDLLLREKNYKEALEAYANIKANPLSESVFLNRMQCLYHLGWYATLADECEETLQKENLNADQKLQTTYFLAIALYQQCLNATQEPEILEKLARRAEPYFAGLFESQLSEEVAAAFAHLCCILKDYAKAANIYLDLANQDPNAEEEMLFQAALIQAEYDKNLASQTFQEISQKGGKKALDAFYNQLVLQFEMHQFEELISRKEEIFKTIPEERAAMAHFFLGESFFALKNYPKAILELQLFLNESAPSESLYTALTSIFEAAYQTDDLSTFEMALAKFQEHYPNDPGLSKALFSRAKLLKNLGKTSDARKEIETLLAKDPDFSQKVEGFFELIHLDYQEKSWNCCSERARLFLSQYPEHELAPFAWRYLASAMAELSIQDPTMRDPLISVLEELLQKKETFSPQEMSDWQFLLAKLHFDYKEYEKAAQILQPLLETEESFAQKPNAILLLALCYRDGAKDLSSFCSLAERAIEEQSNLIDLGSLHASLFNAYLEQADSDLLQKAADHLFAAFKLNFEIQKENLLWLVETYEKTPELAEKTASLLEFLLHQSNTESLFLEQMTCKLAKTYATLGRTEDQIALLEDLQEKYRNAPSLSWNSEREILLLLAEGYIARGDRQRALSLFDTILATSANVRSPINASAALQSTQLHIAELEKENCDPTQPKWMKILTQLKDLILQKTLPNEPLHLEAAIEYAELQNRFDPSLQKRLALWTKTKRDFETNEDLLSKDYHEARSHFPHIDAIYQNYLKFMEAEILLAQAEIAANQQEETQKELQAKGKDLLLQIMHQKVHPALTSRAEKQLEMIDANR